MFSVVSLAFEQDLPYSMANKGVNNTHPGGNIHKVEAIRFGQNCKPFSTTNPMDNWSMRGCLIRLKYINVVAQEKIIVITTTINCLRAKAKRS